MKTAFWDIFLTESLQKPWRVLPKPTADSQIPMPIAPYVFVFRETMSDEKEEMLSKMVKALKWSNQKVQILNITLDHVEDLTTWSDAKGILFFGVDFPGDFGLIKNWFGHRIGKTYSLQNLLDQTELKKQTWQHLKNFAGI